MPKQGPWGGPTTEKGEQIAGEEGHCLYTEIDPNTPGSQDSVHNAEIVDYVLGL